ncbi:hypothetical protein MRX96_014521 [Rhipicephalus microplus]
MTSSVKKLALIKKHNQTCLRSGENLYYETISEKDATVPPANVENRTIVGMLSISDISLNAFMIAFDELRPRSKLQIVYLEVDWQGEGLGIDLSAVFAKLDSLELRCHNIGSGFAKEVARYIEGSDSLQEIVISERCGGDEGAARIIKAIGRNHTLKKFALAEMELSSKMLITFTEMLATSSTLELLDISSACATEKDKVSWLLSRRRYINVFKRLEIKWSNRLLSELGTFIRNQASRSKVSVSFGSIADERAVRHFCDAVTSDKKLRELFIHENKYRNAYDESGGTEDENEDEEREDTVDAREDAAGKLARRVDPVKRKRTLRKRLGSKCTRNDNERHLASIFDAVKENCSIRKFYMGTDLVTSEMATSLSELFAVNRTLTHVHVCSFQEISPSDVDTVLRGLQKTYNLNPLGVHTKTNQLGTYFETYALSHRNSALLNKSSRFVISGVGVSDQQGTDGPKNVHSSGRLVRKVHERVKRPRSLLGTNST